MSVQSRIAGLVGRPSVWVAFFALAFAFHIGRAMMNPKPHPLPKALGVLDLFRLTDQRGRTFSTQKVSGSVWVGSVFCTKCPNVDPNLMRIMHDIQHRSRNLGHRFMIVSVSVDPSEDTVPVVADYAKSQKASTRRWAFLTGPKDDVRRLVADLYADDTRQDLVDPNSEAIQPSAPHRLVLVDQVTQIRGYYDARDETQIARLLDDAALLLNFAHRPAPRAPAE